MCGIGGIRRMGERPIAAWQVDMLACSLEHRGNDATGLAVAFRDGRIEVFKDHEPAWRFLSQRRTREWLEAQLAEDSAQTVLVHTRKMTKGSQWQNKNNHPMWAGKSAVVHNGMISNDDRLFKELELERSAETDSDIIRAIIDRYDLDRGLIGREGKLGKLAGSVAAAVVHVDHPGKVLLLRSNNPLFVASNGEHVAWASTKKSCYLVLKRWVNRHGIDMAINDDKLAFVSMPNNTGWFLGDKLEWHERFEASGWARNTTYNVNTPDWRKRREESERKDREAREEREKKAREESQSVAAPPRGEDATRIPGAVVTTPPRRRPDFVVCPGGCETILDCRDHGPDVPLWELTCTRCHCSLAKGRPCQENGEPLVN